jgi:hypothetical protein
VQAWGLLKLGEGLQTMFAIVEGWKEAKLDRWRGLLEE